MAAFHPNLPSAFEPLRTLHENGMKQRGIAIAFAAEAECRRTAKCPSLGHGARHCCCGRPTRTVAAGVVSGPPSSPGHARRGSGHPWRSEVYAGEPHLAESDQQMPFRPSRARKIDAAEKRATLARDQ